MNIQHLELGQPNTRSAGLVRENGGDWRQPTELEATTIDKARLTQENELLRSSFDWDAAVNALSGACNLIDVYKSGDELNWSAWDKAVRKDCSDVLRACISIAKRCDAALALSSPVPTEAAKL